VVEPVNEIVELVKDLEAALAIVRTNASNQLSLTLLKAEVEVGVTIGKDIKTGGKWAIIEASANRSWSDGHSLTLMLDLKAGLGHAGAKETEALAAGILELASLHRQIKSLNIAEFEVGNLKLSVQFERGASGGLQVVAGGGGTSKSAQKLNLTFRPK
jgi:hypothetical protein